MSISVKDIVEMGAAGTICAVLILLVWKGMPKIVAYLHKQMEVFQQTNDKLLQDAAAQRAAHQKLVDAILVAHNQSLEDCRKDNLHELSKQRHAFIRLVPAVTGIDQSKLKKMMEEEEEST